MEILHPEEVKAADLKPGIQVGMKVIAIVGYADDWAAYQAPLNWTDIHLAEEGNKLDEITAKRLFPRMAEANLYYRR